jgi:protein ImuA
MLKRWRKPDADPLAETSAAVTRWRIAPAPSSPLPVEGIGRPRWHVTLARQRGGEPFELLMEGTDAQGRLALPAEPRHRPDQAARARAAAA